MKVSKQLKSYGESYEAFVARANSCSFFCFDEKPKQRKRKSKAQKLIENMGARELDILLSVLNKQAELVVIGGASYAISRDGERWRVRATSADNDYVVENGKCSCRDCRFRERDCKHVEAIRGIVAKGSVPS
jgi:hypothetical protein